MCVCVLSALPPPLPPPLCPLFGSLVNLLQCDVLLAIEGAVLQWAVEPSGGGWTESMLQRVRLALTPVVLIRSFILKFNFPVVNEERHVCQAFILKVT